MTEIEPTRAWNINLSTLDSGVYFLEPEDNISPEISSINAFFLDSIIMSKTVTVFHFLWNVKRKKNKSRGSLLVKFVVY